MPPPAEPNNKRRKLARCSSSAPCSEHLRAELPVTDRTGRCLLTDGEYDVLLTAEPSQPPPPARGAGAASPRKTSWESFDDGKVEGRWPGLRGCSWWTGIEVLVARRGVTLSVYC